MNGYVQKISRFEFKRDTDNEMLIGPDGCHYDTEAEALYFNMKASCGCGSPHEVHAFLIECLRKFEGDTWPKSGVEAIKDVIASNPEIAAEFIAHYLSSENLMEHGGSVYGSWLTERGKQFIEVGPWEDNAE